MNISVTYMNRTRNAGARLALRVNGVAVSARSAFGSFADPRSVADALAKNHAESIGARIIAVSEEPSNSIRSRWIRRYELSID